MSKGAIVLVAFILYLFVTPYGSELWQYATTDAPGWTGLFKQLGKDLDKLNPL